MRTFRVSLLVLGSLLLSACGYNTLQVQDEATKSAWAEVVNQYQRRADLIPNLVNTVKGFAAQEQAVLLGVTEARARASQITVNADDPASLAQFQAAQGDVSSALSRLLVVGRELPGAQVRPEFPRPAGAARGHREPHHRGTQPLHPGSAGLQRHGAQVPDQPDGDDVRLQGEAELHGRKRGCDREAADGGLRYASTGAGARARTGARDRLDLRASRRPPGAA